MVISLILSSRIVSLLSYPSYDHLLINIPPNDHLLTNIPINTNLPCVALTLGIEDKDALINLMATDANKLGASPWVVFFLAQWVFSLFSLPIVLFCLYQVVGVAAFAGVASILIGGILTQLVAYLLVPLVKAVQMYRDARAKEFNRFLASVKSSKFSSLESQWLKRLEVARALELGALVGVRFVSVGNTLLGVSYYVFFDFKLFNIA